MIVHVFVANWNHLSPSVSKGFITTYKSDAEHYYILYGEQNYDKDQYIRLYSELNFTNYIFCQSYSKFLRVIFKLRNNAILFHFGRYHWFLGAMMVGCRNLNWVCWGSGAKTKGTIKSQLMAPLKSFIYQRFNSIVTLMEPDRLSIIKDFNVSPERVRTIPYNGSSQDETPKDLLCRDLSHLQNHSGKPVILLGNNPTCISSYLHVLHLLQPYKGKIKVQCLLNYNLNKDDRYENLIKIGKSIFANDFQCNEDFHEGYTNYVNYMNTCDIYICAVEKQTGLGAITTCLKLGKKVYITGKNLDWINSQFHANVFDVNLINESMSFEEFIKPLTDDAKNYNYNCFIKYKSEWRDKWKSYLKELDNF